MTGILKGFDFAIAYLDNYHHFEHNSGRASFLHIKQVFEKL